MHPYQDELIMAEKEVEIRLDDDANINIDLKLTKQQTSMYTKVPPVPQKN